MYTKMAKRWRKNAENVCTKTHAINSDLYMILSFIFQFNTTWKIHLYIFCHCSKIEPWKNQTQCLLRIAWQRKEIVIIIDHLMSNEQKEKRFHFYFFLFSDFFAWNQTLKPAIWYVHKSQFLRWTQCLVWDGVCWRCWCFLLPLSLCMCLSLVLPLQNIN